MNANPRKIGAINLRFTIPGSLKDLEAKTKQVLKNTAVTCPVQQSIHPEIAVKIDWGHWT
ncbi:MAG: hypothetical protein NVS1B13_17050 [Flavisolibacter sp.]